MEQSKDDEEPGPSGIKSNERKNIVSGKRNTNASAPTEPIPKRMKRSIDGTTTEQDPNAAVKSYKTPKVLVPEPPGIETSDIKVNLKGKRIINATKPIVKRSKTNIDDTTTLQVSDAVKSTDSSEDESNTTCGTLASGPEHEPWGIRHSLHGDIYQIKLLMLVLFRSLIKLEEENISKHEFSLTTELKEAEVFDDIVLNCGQLYSYIQAKHSRVKTNINLTNLMNETGGDFSVIKYFHSYCDMLQKDKFKDFIICTNIGLHDDVINIDGKEQIEPVNMDILKFKNNFKAKLYKIKYKYKLYKDLKTLLQNNPSNALAMQLAEMFCDKNKVCEKSLLQCHRDWLLDKVFEIKNDDIIEFKKDFLTNNPEDKEMIIKLKDCFRNARVTNILQETELNVDDIFTVNPKDFKAQDLETLATNLSVLLNTKRILKLKYKLLSNSYRGWLMNKVFEMHEDGEIKKVQFRDNFLKKQFDESDKEMKIFSVRFWNTINNAKKKKEINRELTETDIFTSNFNNLPVDSLVSKLADISYKKDMTFKSEEKILLNRYRDWLLDKVYDINKDNNTLKFKSDFIKKQCEGKALIEFRELFIDHVQKMKVMTNVTTQLKKKDLFPENDNENEIGKFLEKFVLAVDQPDEQELRKIIGDEVGEYMNLIDDDNPIASDFFEFMIDWVKAKNGQWMTYKDGMKLFKRLKFRLAGAGLIGLSDAYKSSINKDYRFNDNVKVIEKVRHFLKKDEKTKEKSRNEKILIIYYKYQLLSAIKILQANPDTRANEVIFSDFDTLVSLKDGTTCPILALQAENKTYFVLDNITKLNENEIILKKFITVLKQNTKKQIIFNISYEEKEAAQNLFEKLLKELECDTLNWIISEDDDDNNLCNLSCQSQEKLLQESKVIFQGKEVVLNSLLEGNLNLIHGEVLSKLISKTGIEIGISPINDKYIETKQYLVEPTLQICTIRNDIFNLDKKFFITYHSQITYSELQLKNKEIILISDDENKFRDLCNRRNNKTIHWVTESVKFKYTFINYPEELFFPIFINWQTIPQISLQKELFPESDIQRCQILVVLPDKILEKPEEAKIIFINQIKQCTQLILETESHKEKRIYELNTENVKEKLIAALPLSQITESILETIQVILAMCESVGDTPLIDLYPFKQYAGKIKYILKREETLLWRQTEGNISKLRQYKQNKWHDYKLKDVISINDKVGIIAGQPGTGKSILLTHLAIEEQSSSRIPWVIKADLVKFRNEFYEMKNKEINAMKWLCKFLKSEPLEANNGRKYEFHNLVNGNFDGTMFFQVDEDFNFKEKDLLEANLFIYYYNSGKIIVCLDGFDEISPLCKTVVLKLMEKLKITKVRKIWVTTRPQNILGELENSLDTMSYDIAPLSKRQQVDMFTKLLKIKSNTTPQEIITSFIQNILHKFGEKVNHNNPNNLYEFTCTPLHVTMMATWYEDNLKHKSDSDDLDVWTKSLVQNFNLHDLYQKFIDIKLDFIYNLAKQTNLTDFYDKRGKRKQVLECHGFLALSELFPEKILDLISEDKQHKNCKTCKSIMEAKEKTGLIIGVYDDTPQFVHRTFAEYFVADCLAMLIKNDKQPECQSAKEFLYDIWNKKHVENRVILNFLNYKFVSLCDNKTHKAELTAALSKSLHTIDPIENNIRDYFGRTPLHLACYNFKPNHWKILLKRNKKELSAQDTLFKWTPLHYAIASTKYTDTIMEKTSDYDDDDEEEKYTNLYDVVNMQDFKGRTPIILAVLHDNKDMMKSLLKFNPDVNIMDNSEYSAIQYSQDFEYYFHFIAFGAKQDKRREKKLFSQEQSVSGFHLIIKYVMEYNQNMINYLKRQSNQFKVSMFCEILRQDGENVTSDAFSALCEIVDVNTQDIEGKTALHHIVDGNYLARIKNLIDNGANVDLKDKHNRTALHYAITWPAINILLQTRSDIINVRDNLGKTALHYVSTHEMRSASLVNCLLYYEAKTEIKDYRGKTAIQYAFYNEVKVIYLLRSGAYYDVVDTSELREGSILKTVKQLFDSVKDNDLINVRSLLDVCDHKNVVVNSRTKDSGKTPLDIAVNGGYKDIVDCLLQHGAYRFSMHHENSDVEKKLFKAVDEVNLAQIKECLNNGAKINCINYSSSMQPLHLAIKHGNFEVTELLLKGANIDARVANNYTILHIAAESGHTHILEYLLNNDNITELVNAEDARGETPLHKAVRRNDTVAVKELLRKGAVVLKENQTSKLEEIVHLDRMNIFHAEILFFLASENNNTEIGEMMYYKLDSMFNNNNLDSYANLSVEDKINVANNITNRPYNDYRDFKRHPYLKIVTFLKECLGSR